MKRRLTSFLLVLAMVITTFLQPMSVQAEGETETEVKKNYSVTLPAGYDDDHSYPVVYVMPQDGYAQDDSGITEKLQAAMEAGTSTAMIIVEPEFKEGENLYDAMDAIIAEVDAEYNTIADADHRAIVGTGVGGYLAYVLGLTEENPDPYPTVTPDTPDTPGESETVEKEDIVVNTEVTIAGQYPTSIEVKVEDATGLDALTAADFTVAGQSAGWLTTELHDFEATFSDVVVDGNVVTLTFDSFPERYPYVDNYTVTCSANEALTFTVTKDTQTITPIADEFEQVRAADGGEFDYNLFTPEDTSVAQPLVIVFHGFGDDENLYHNRLATAWADPDNQAERPAYVLAPMFGGWDMYTKANREVVYANVYDKVQQMIKDGQVDPSRIYVTGKSYGGGATYEFLEKYPELAAGAIAMCGQSTSPYSDVQSNLNKIVDVPLWIAHATNDPTVKVSCSQDVYNKLQRAGSTVVKYTEYSDEEMPAVVTPVVGPDVQGIESYHAVEAVVLEDTAYMEWLFEQVNEVPPVPQTLDAPKNFKYIASTRGDFVSEDNAWYATYGDVYGYMEEIGAENLGGFYTYVDSPVDDAWSDMENSTNDIGQLIINNGTSDDVCEFTTRLGEFDDAFLTESANRIARRITDGVLASAISGTVALKDTVLSATASTFDVDYTVDTTEAINTFSSKAETMEIVVEVVDPSTDEVLASSSATAETGTAAAGTLTLDKNIKGTSAEVVLSVKVLGAKFELATATALSVRETVVDGDYQLIDLMGDWNFHYIKRSEGKGYDMVKEDIESGAFKDWSVVQPALNWWKPGFGDLVSNFGGAYAEYGYIGEGWYAREFEVPANFDAQELYISVGNLDDRGQTYINGQLVGETGMVDGTPNGESAWEAYSYYKVDPSILNIGGTNTIVVCCYNDGMGGGGWYSGPVALYSKSAFEADESTASYFTEYSFESEYAASALGKEGTHTNKYLVALPEGYEENPDRYYPTVYLMHQYNSTHKSYMTDDVDRLLRNAAKEGLLDDMIIVVPNSEESSFWRGDWSKMVSEELVPLIDSQYRTIKDARYRFTAGCSMGGQGAFGVALQNPDTFSGAISFFGAFSMGGNASPNKIVEEESVEYIDNFAMYFICGNQDIYGFGDCATELHQQLLAKGIDHEYFIENGGHNSEFYLPHFVEGFEYVRDNMYKSSESVASYLDAEVSVDKNSNLEVDFRASKGISKYFNSIPASSYTKDTTPDLSIPLTIRVEQNGEVVFEAVERDLAISKDDRTDFFKYDLSDYVVADEQYTVSVVASIFDLTLEITNETVNKTEVESAELSAARLVYNGKTRIPSVKVVNEYGKKLVEGTDYTVTITNEAGEVVTAPTEVGTYTVKVSYIGKYKGTKADKMDYTIVPKAVTDMKAELAGYDDVKVSWTASEGATGYYVYYKKSTASSYSNYKVTTKTAITIKNLSDGVTYKFKVVPYYGEDKVKSTAYTTKTATTLKKVTNVKVVRNGKKVTVSWKNIAGETGYQISRSTSKTTTANTQRYKGAALTSKTLTLSKASKYYYKVRAYKVTSDGTTVYGPWSTVVYK